MTFLVPESPELSSEGYRITSLVNKTNMVILYFFLFYYGLTIMLTMVFILDGNSDHDAHA